MYVCLSACLYVCLFAKRHICLSHYLPVCVCLPVCLPACLSSRSFECLPACRSACLSLSLCVCPSVYLSVCLSVCLSICTSACVYVSLFAFVSSCLSLCQFVFLSVCLLACLSVRQLSLWIRTLSFLKFDFKNKLWLLNLFTLTSRDHCPNIFHKLLLAFPQVHACLNKSVFPKLWSADPWESVRLWVRGKLLIFLEFRERKCVHFCIQSLIKIYS